MTIRKLLLNIVFTLAAAGLAAPAGAQGNLEKLDKAYRQDVGTAGARLTAHAATARDALGGLAIGAVILAILAAACTVLGLRRRIQEYS